MNRTLAAALSTLLPTEEHTLLLRACLLPDKPGRSAWARFTARVPDLAVLFRTDFGRLKRLSPLLLWAARRSELPIEAGLSTVLRTAYLREELRAKAYGEILGPVLRQLGNAGVPFLLLKGAALGETVYPQPALRHSHDIDILVRADDLSDVRKPLIDSGFDPDESPAADSADEALYHHRSALPVRVHTRLFRIDHYRVDWEVLWKRHVAVRVAGEPAQILSPADNLLHALGHASYCPSRATLLWACDAWLILRAVPDLDWDHFLEQARRSRLTVPLALMLDYLSEELDSPIPEPVRRELGEDAASASRLDRDLSLYAARQSLGTDVREMLARVAGGRAKLRLASWILFPSQEYIRWAHGVDRRDLVLLSYVRRPMSILGRRLALRPPPGAAGEPDRQ